MSINYIKTRPHDRICNCRRREPRRGNTQREQNRLITKGRHQCHPKAMGAQFHRMHPAEAQPALGALLKDSVMTFTMRRKTGFYSLFICLGLFPF